MEITKECFQHFYGLLLSLQFTEKTNPHSKNSFTMESVGKRYRCCLVSCVSIDMTSIFRKGVYNPVKNYQ